MHAETEMLRVYVLEEQDMGLWFDFGSGLID